MVKVGKQDALILLGIILIGLFLRFYNLTDNIFFSYDQARDAQRIYDMVHNGELKLVGPETDIPGVFNGPLLYYLLLPGYFLTQFNPNAAAFTLILVNLLGIPLLYLAGKILFNKWVGLIAGFLWAVSFEQVNYARYISNTGIMPVPALLFFFGVALYAFKKNPWGLVLSAVGLAGAIHMAFYFIYLILFYFIFPPRLKKKYYIISGAILTGLLSPFLVAELKFRFITTHSLLQYFTEQSTPSKIIDQVSQFWQSLAQSLYYSTFSFNNFLALLLFIGAVVYGYKTVKQKAHVHFLLLWVLSTLPLFAFKSGVITGSSIHSSIQGGVSLLIALALYQLYQDKKYLFAIGFLLLIMVSNTRLFISDNFLSTRIFAYQPILYTHQKQLIDYTYAAAIKEKFSICALTNPFFINTSWSTLYKIYGEKKYGYLPTWSGQKQPVNKSFLPYDTEHVKARFLIIEPPSGVTKNAVQTTLYLEDQVSALEETKKFGELIVQKRKLATDKSLLKDTQNLSAEDRINVQHIIAVDPRYSCFTTYE